MTRGGSRAGAGGQKPKLPDDQRRKKIHIVLAPETISFLDTEARRRRVSRGRIVDALVKEREPL